MPDPRRSARAAAGFAIGAALVLCLAGCDGPAPEEMEWAPPRVVAPGVVSTAAIESSAAFLPDGSLVVTRRSGVWGERGGTSRLIVFRTARSGALEEAATLFPEIPSAGGPFVSPDGRRIVFSAPAAGPGRDDRDLWMAERRGSGWSEPRPLPPPVNSEHEEMGASLDAAGNLVFSSTRPSGLPGTGSGDLWHARWTGRGFMAPEPIGPPVSSPHGEWNALLAPDASFLLFEASGRPTNVSVPGDLYLSWADGDGWSEPLPLAELNTEGSELNARLSPDGRWLVFASSRAGGPGEVDLYTVPAGPLLARYRPTRARREGLESRFPPQR